MAKPSAIPVITRRLVENNLYRLHAANANRSIARRTTAVDALIGGVAGGLPSMSYFLWWSFQSPLEDQLFEMPFMLTALCGMFIGAACGMSCRMLSRSPAAYTASSILNTIIWCCAGSVAGFFIGGLIVGVCSQTSPLLLPLFQAAAILAALVFVPQMSQ